MGHSNDFLKITPKAQAKTNRKKQVDYIQLKRFYMAKETINKVKRQPTEWGKVFAIYLS